MSSEELRPHGAMGTPGNRRPRLGQSRPRSPGRATGRVSVSRTAPSGTIQAAQVGEFASPMEQSARTVRPKRQTATLIAALPSASANFTGTALPIQRAMRFLVPKNS